MSVPDILDELHEHEGLVKCLNSLCLSLPADDWLALVGLESRLVDLISISRSSDGRNKLANLRAIPSLLHLLGRFHKSYQLGQLSPKGIHILLLLLKLARNLCAGDSSNQDAFLESGGVAVLAPIVVFLLSSGSRLLRHQVTGLGDLSDGVPGKDSILERMKASISSEATSIVVMIPEQVSVLQMMLQLLGNFARRGEACRAAVWEEFFPGLLLELAALRVREICGPLCMLLYTTCQSNPKRCCQLSQGDGAALVALLLVVLAVDTDSDRVSTSNEQIEWFELLVQQLCFQEPLFPLLFTNLGVPPLSREVELLKVNTDELLAVCQLCLETASPTSLQASLLYILCDSLSSQEANFSHLSFGEDKSGQCVVKLPVPLKSLCFMTNILRRAAECSGKDAEVSFVPTLSCAPPASQILGFVLLLLRISCAWGSSSGDHIKLTTVLLSHGLVDLVLDLLEALGPPGVPCERPTVAIPLRDRCAPLVTACPHKNPYEGYRRDLVAVIANVSHQNFCVQERVREKGSLLVVLQQCTVEKGNSFLREWGLWAMRNLLEGNHKNQQEIAHLEVKESLNLPELRRMGLQVRIDPNTRRPRLVNDDSLNPHP